MTKLSTKPGPFGSQVYSGGPKYFQVGLPCWVSQICSWKFPKKWMDASRKMSEGTRTLPDSPLRNAGDTQRPWLDGMTDFMPMGYPQLLVHRLC